MRVRVPPRALLIGRTVLTTLTFFITFLSFSKKILFIPLDSRPACLQFNQMIANLSEDELIIPKKEWLDNLSKPAECDLILDWMENINPSNIDGCVISLDLLLYGGLVASRDPKVSLDIAQQRLQRLLKIRSQFKDKIFYAYSIIMRVAPTATPENSDYYNSLIQYLKIEDQNKIANSPSLIEQAKKINEKLPPFVLENYLKSRERNHCIQNLLLDEVSRNNFDYFVLGQDDATQYGPHREEIKKLKQKIKKNCLTPNQIHYAQGADQIGSLLISKILLGNRQTTPKIAVICSDPNKLTSTAQYEFRPLRQTIYDQIHLSGGKWVQPHENPDYTLYVNMPQPQFSSFYPFLGLFFNSLDVSHQVAFADIDLNYTNRTGIAQTQSGNIHLLNYLLKDGKIFNILGYASWNTAGNTIGTVVPSANLRWLALNKTNNLNTQINHYKWTFHRVLDDHVFHFYTRQVGRAHAQKNSWNISLLKPNENKEITSLLNQNMNEHAQQIFKDSLQGKKFNVQNRSYEITKLENLTLNLPWNRLFESEIDFSLKYQ